jgi:hypothetical protein
MAKIGYNNGILTSLSLVVDPKSASNSILYFNESGVQKWVAGNDTSDDSWHLSQGGTLATNDAITILPSRSILLPQQPKFQVYNNVTIPNVTGDGTIYIINFDTVDFDIQSGFSNPYYVLPCSGTFLFTAYIQFTGLTNAHIASQLLMENITKVERQYGARFNPWDLSDNGNLTIEMSGLFTGSAGDQICLITYVDGGAKVVSITGGALSGETSCFNGVLLN